MTAPRVSPGVPVGYDPSDVPVYEDTAARDEAYYRAEREETPFLAVERYEGGYAITYDLLPAGYELARPARKELTEQLSQKIEAVVNHLYDDYPDEHPYSDLQIPRSEAGTPDPWVLGSSPSSAAIAAKLGLPYCFAAFIRPQLATQSFEAYREQFQPSSLAGGVDEPEGMIAVNAVCAETDDEAARLRAVAEASYKRMQRGVVGTRPSIEEAIDELGSVPEPTPATLDAGDWPRAISGSPETVASLLEQFAERVGIDEVMIQHIHATHDDALRSHELIADGVGLNYQ